MVSLQKICQLLGLRNEESDPDIYSVLESVSWIWRGTGVLIVVPEGPVGRRKYTTKKFLIGYNILIFFAFTSSIIQQHFDEYHDRIVMNIGLDVKVHMVTRISMNWVNMLAMISWKMIINGKFIETINLLVKQDQILYGIGCRLKNESSRKKILICIRLYFISNFLFSLNEILFLKLEFRAIINWFVWWLPLLIHKSSICYFLCLVWMIGIRFDAINKKLEFVVSYSSSDPQLLIDSKKCVRMVRTIGNVHAGLCKITKNLNYIFVITLLTSALEAFIFVALVLYSLIVEIQGNKDIIQLTGGSFFMFMCGFPIVTIVVMCNQTMKQASKAERLLHRMNLRESSRIFSELIQVFSMQMLHQKLSFSVGGLFTLEPALLQAITAAITTNLIILIQFGNMNDILLQKI